MTTPLPPLSAMHLQSLLESIPTIHDKESTQLELLFHKLKVNFHMGDMADDEFYRDLARMLVKCHQRSERRSRSRVGGGIGGKVEVGDTSRKNNKNGSIGNGTFSVTTGTGGRNSSYMRATNPARRMEVELEEEDNDNDDDSDDLSDTLPDIPDLDIPDIGIGVNGKRGGYKFKNPSAHRGSSSSGMGSDDDDDEFLDNDNHDSDAEEMERLRREDVMDDMEQMNLSNISFRDRYVNQTSAGTTAAASAAAASAAATPNANSNPVGATPVTTAEDANNPKTKTPGSSNSISFKLLEEFQMMGTAVKGKVKAAAAAFEQSASSVLSPSSIDSPVEGRGGNGSGNGNGDEGGIDESMRYDAHSPIMNKINISDDDSLDDFGTPRSSLDPANTSQQMDMSYQIDGLIDPDAASSPTKGQGQETNQPVGNLFSPIYNASEPASTDAEPTTKKVPVAAREEEILKPSNLFPIQPILVEKEVPVSVSKLSISDDTDMNSNTNTNSNNTNGDAKGPSPFKTARDMFEAKTSNVDASPATTANTNAANTKAASFKSSDKAFSSKVASPSPLAPSLSQTQTQPQPTSVFARSSSARSVFEVNPSPGMMSMSREESFKSLPDNTKEKVKVKAKIANPTTQPTTSAFARSSSIFEAKSSNTTSSSNDIAGNNANANAMDTSTHTQSSVARASSIFEAKSSNNGNGNAMDTSNHTHTSFSSNADKLKSPLREKVISNSNNLTPSRLPRSIFETKGANTGNSATDVSVQSISVEGKLKSPLKEDKNAGRSKMASPVPATAPQPPLVAFKRTVFEAKSVKGANANTSTSFAMDTSVQSSVAELRETMNAAAATSKMASPAPAPVSQPKSAFARSSSMFEAKSKSTNAGNDANTMDTSIQGSVADTSTLKSPVRENMNADKVASPVPQPASTFGRSVFEAKSANAGNNTTNISVQSSVADATNTLKSPFRENKGSKVAGSSQQLPTVFAQGSSEVKNTGVDIASSLQRKAKSASQPQPSNTQNMFGTNLNTSKDFGSFTALEKTPNKMDPNESFTSVASSQQSFSFAKNIFEGNNFAASTKDLGSSPSPFTSPVRANVAPKPPNAASLSFSPQSISTAAMHTNSFLNKTPPKPVVFGTSTSTSQPVPPIPPKSPAVENPLDSSISSKSIPKQSASSSESTGMDVSPTPQTSKKPMNVFQPIPPKVAANVPVAPNNVPPTAVPPMPAQGVIPSVSFQVDLTKSKNHGKRASPRNRSRVKKKLNIDTTRANRMNSKLNTTVGSSNGLKTPNNPAPSFESNGDGLVSPEAMDVDTPKAESSESVPASHVPTVPVGDENRNIANQPSATVMNDLVFNIGTGSNPTSNAGRKVAAWKTNKSKKPSVTTQRFKATVPESVLNQRSDAAQKKKKEKEALVTRLRDEAKKFYGNRQYRDSINKYTDAIMASTNNFTNMPNPIKKSAESESLAALYGNRAAGLMMVGAYNAAASDCEKALTFLNDYNPLSLNLYNHDQVLAYLKVDGGLTLMTKLHARKARAYIKCGRDKEAETTFQQTARIAQAGLACHEKIKTHATMTGSKIPMDVQQMSQKVLNQCLTEAHLFSRDLERLRSNIQSIGSMGGVRRAVDSPLVRQNNPHLLPHVNTCLKISPGDERMQENKVIILASMRRWTELNLFCESLACSNAEFDGIFVGDLSNKNNLFSYLQPAKFINGSGLKTMIDGGKTVMNPQQTAEAILRLPSNVAKLYVRGLRLEERYEDAEYALKSLESLMDHFKSAMLSPSHKSHKKKYHWCAAEHEMIRKTIKEKTLGDDCYREGDYQQAAGWYAAVLKVDNKDMDSKYRNPWEIETAGGRLHAVLHCNRAACLMALKKYEDAAKECTAALKIQTAYMKAMLRRARCYARLKRFAESLSEYDRWASLVKEAKSNPNHRNVNTCQFDRASDVSDADYKKAMAERAEASNLKHLAEEKARQEAEEARRRASSTFNRERSYTQNRSTAGSRPWDSFNGSGPKTNQSARGYNRSSSAYERTNKSKSKQHSNYSKSNSSNRFKDNAYSNTRNSNTNNAQPSPSSDSVKCHYKVLNVTQDATQNAIKKAYHKLALKYHPDKNSSDAAADIFRKVKVAYDTLKDEKTRRQYDVERLRQFSYY